MPPDDPPIEARPLPPGADRDAPQPAHDIFVSYSANDKPVADAIVARLEQAGIRCWVAPRDIVPGQVWGGAIVRAIETARLMVVVLSGASNESRQVIREVERAVANDVVVVPFRIESMEPTGAMAYFLAAEHWLDAMSPPLESHISRLVSIAQALLGSMSPAQGHAPGTVAEPVSPPVQPAPGAAPRARPRALITAVVAVAFLAVAGMAGVLALAPSSPAPPSPSAASSSPSPAAPSASARIPVEVPVAAIATGDCLLTPYPFADNSASQAQYWGAPPGGSWPPTFLVVSCDQPHGAEAFFAGESWEALEADAMYPGDLAVQGSWDARCLSEFSRYVGSPASQSRLERTGWSTDAGGWAAGMRQMACLAYDRGGAHLVGSIRGISR